MSWGTITCLDCGHKFDSETAELKALRKIQGPVGSPAPPFFWHSEISAVDPIPLCPECGLAQREARWPASFLLVPLALLWMTGLAAAVAASSEKVPLSVVMYGVWFSIGLTGAGLVASLVAHAIAKPVRC
ncbi:hypothetical protein [Maricaulis sp.]|uniref:hypothetical protein n=1 Tax=Maricaulis sp. TaxID=1486257 RepID=UPI003298B2EE